MKHFPWGDPMKPINKQAARGTGWERNPPTKEKPPVWTKPESSIARTGKGSHKAVLRFQAERALSIIEATERRCRMGGESVNLADIARRLGNAASALRAGLR